LAEPTFGGLFEQAASAAAEQARAHLAARWPAALVDVREGPPERVILRAAQELGSDVVALGWSGSGRVRRLLAGSVSRAVARRAPCPVLVVRRSAEDVRRILVGYDASVHADAAVRFVSRLRPARGGRIRLLTVVDEVQLPAHPLLPAASRRALRSAVSRVNEERHAAAHATLEAPAALLGESGWKVERVVMAGAPLRILLDQVGNWNADLVAVGATGAAGLDRVLLGSVAEGVLDRCPVPILIAR
jgi:nucleotide-binding universal stress UspA family protein